MAREKYSGTFRKERIRSLPKKILQSQDIQIRPGYSARATLWVADRPESNLLPTVNLTLSHSDDRIRFCFQNTADLIIFLERLREFVGGRSLKVHEAQTMALQECHAYHLERQLPALNDNTVYTVLQGEERDRVDISTGEIHEVDSED